jgi:hypothetical protein
MPSPSSQVEPRHSGKPKSMNFNAAEGIFDVSLD